MVTREIKGEYVRDKYKCLEEVLYGLLCQYQHKMINKPFHIYMWKYKGSTNISTDIPSPCIISRSIITKHDQDYTQSNGN